MAWDTRRWKPAVFPHIDENGPVSTAPGMLAVWSTLYKVSTDSKIKVLNDTLGDTLIQSCALSSDGRYLLAHTARAASYPDEHMVLWNTATGKETQLEHNALCCAGAFSPDHRLIATGCDDNTVKIWSTCDQRLLRTLDCDDATVRSVAFSSDGKLLASGSADGTVKLWDVSIISRPEPRKIDRSGQVRLISDEYKIEPAGISADGRLLSSHDVESDKVWNAVSGQVVHIAGAHHYTSELSPSGRLFAQVEDHSVDVLRTRDWRRICRLPITVDPQELEISLAFSTDESKIRITEGEDSAGRWWDLRHRRGRPIAVGGEAAPDEADAVFSSDGRLIASVLSDHSIRIRLRRTGAAVCHLQPRTEDGSIPGVFSNDNRWFVTFTCRAAEIWDTHSGRRLGVITPFAGDIEAAAFSRRGHRLAIGAENGTVQLWNPDTGHRTTTFAGPGLPVRLLEFSTNGDLIAVGSSHARMTLWRCRAPVTPA